VLKGVFSVVDSGVLSEPIVVIRFMIEDSGLSGKVFLNPPGGLIFSTPYGT
jgi:hypothetical protein